MRKKKGRNQIADNSNFLFNFRCSVSFLKVENMFSRQYLLLFSISHKDNFVELYPIDSLSSTVCQGSDDSFFGVLFGNFFVPEDDQEGYVFVDRNR